VRRSFLGLLLAAAPWCVGAQMSQAPVAAASGPLSLATALERARTYEARYQAAEASFRAEREVLDQARGLLLPEVNASASRTYNQLSAVFGNQQRQSLDYFSGGSSVTLRQPLYRPENWSRYQQAKSEVHRLEATLLSDRNKLMVDVSAAYLEVLRALSEYRSNQAQQTSLRAQATAAARGVPLGLISATERDERQARAEIAGVRTLQSEAKLIQARSQLEKMIGVKVTELLAPGDAALTGDSFAVEDLQVWQDKAAERSPEIRAARAALEVAKEGVDRAKAGHKPTVDLIAARSKSTSESFTAISNTYYNTSVGVQLSVPLYSGGRASSAVRQAVAQAEKAQAQLEFTQRETTVLVEREHLLVRQAGQRLRAHEAVIRAAQQNLLAARQGLERGTRSQLDVAEAQGQLDSALYEQAGARLELLAARMRLQSLVDEVDETTVSRLGAVLVQPVNVQR
jgi:outer membrane protein, protease secretion system